MNQKEIESLINEILGPRLGLYGFNFVKSKKKFVRRHDGVDQSFSYSISNYNPVYRVHFGVKIRYGEVERQYADLCRGFARYPPDFGLVVTNFVDFGEDRFFAVRSGEDVEAMVDRVGAIVGDKIIPYFDKNSCASNLFKNYESGNLIISIDGDEREFRVIYCALINGSSKWKEMITSLERSILDGAGSDSFAAKNFYLLSKAIEDCIVGDTLKIF